MFVAGGKLNDAGKGAFVVGAWFCGKRAYRSIMRIALLSAVVLFALGSVLRADPLPVGSPAPDVTGTDQNGKPVKFTDVYAKGITLVYFYPKSGTSGCTAEACSLRDNYAKLQSQGLQVIGVSRDSVAAQSKFQSENQLPFTIISDPDGTIAAAFGVPKLMGVLPVDARQSFLVKDGKIAWNSPHAQTKKSAEEVEAALASLK
jgi:peroxiredoxin Q/BCP